MPGYPQWLRAQVGPHLIPLVYASAIVRDEAGRILLQRRADFRNAWWGLPGGLLEPGETHPACLRREVFEETGLRVEPVRLTGLYSSPRYNVTYPNGDQVQQITLCYECRIAGGDLRPDGREILSLGFFPPSDLPAFPIWYAEMVHHALQLLPTPYFDPPESHPADTPFPTLMSLRRVIGSAPFIHPGASAFVRDGAGRILLQRRADFAVWAWPAGALNVGETLAQTAIRETWEETGLEVEPVRLMHVYAGDELTYPNGDRLLPVGHVFACRIVGGDLRPDGHESLEVGFFSLEDLPPIWPGLERRIQAALAEGLGA